mmetsp:Transcript_54924/g.152104  ORF Transcript_54924/g.152104 Transcript_54924/m.152104 type:complete len:224 (+) Transcript_54924:167-838(+)
MFSFGPKEEKLTPKEQTRKWTRELKREQRGLDRQIGSIEREEAKIQREIKKAARAKPPNMTVINTLAKELVRSRKAKERIYTSRATLNSVSMQLQNQLAMATMAGAISKSTEIMTAMGKLVSAPAIAMTMRNMAREMERAGLIEEMMEDTMEMMDGDEVEEEAEEEVAKTIAEIVGADFAGVAAAPTGAPAVAAKPAAAAEAPAKVEEGEEDMAALRARLEAL